MFSRIVSRVARPAVAASRMPVRMVSGYGSNPPQGAQKSERVAVKGGPSDGKVDPMPGGETPEYSGPSIAEKKKGSGISIDDKVEKMKSDRSSGSGGDAKQTSSGEEWANKDKKQRQDAMKDKGQTGIQPPKQGKDLNGAVPPKRSFHTSARSMAGESRVDSAKGIAETLVEDAGRFKDKVVNKSKAAGLRGAAAAMDAKESIQDSTHKTKKGLRDPETQQNIDELKQSASDMANKAASTAKSAAGAVASGASSAWQATKEAVKTGAAAVADAADDVKSAAREELSTSANKRSGMRVGGSDNGAASGSASSMGSSDNSVKKGLFDGPQEMPQGVNKRATDAQGKQMDTGAPRT